MLATMSITVMLNMRTASARNATKLRQPDVPRVGDAPKSKHEGAQNAVCRGGSKGLEGLTAKHGREGLLSRSLAMSWIGKQKSLWGLFGIDEHQVLLIIVDLIDVRLILGVVIDDAVDDGHGGR